MLTTPSTDQSCPCGSKKAFNSCCKPYIEGAQSAPTAVSLMRSRYTAFALGTVDYLIATTAPNMRKDDDYAIITEQVKNTHWCGLKIINCVDGLKGDSTGEVEFKAYFIADGEGGVLHERSRFYRQGDQWFYADGDVSIVEQ